MLEFNITEILEFHRELNSKESLKHMNKTLMCIAIAIAAVTAFAAPRSPVQCQHPAPHFRPRVMHHVPYHHYHWSPGPAWTSPALVSEAVGGAC